jgi:hypothetical protein
MHNMAETSPDWAEQLPEHLRPFPWQIDALERVRQQAQIPIDEFAFHIAGHPETSVAALHHSLHIVRQTNPHFSEAEASALVLLERAIKSLATDGLTFGLELENEDLDAAEQAQRIASRFDTFDEMAKWIVEQETAIGIPGHEKYRRTEAEVSKILKNDGFSDVWLAVFFALLTGLPTKILLGVLLLQLAASWLSIPRWILLGITWPLAVLVALNVLVMLWSLPTELRSPTPPTGLESKKWETREKLAFAMMTATYMVVGAATVGLLVLWLLV